MNLARFILEPGCFWRLCMATLILFFSACGKKEAPPSPPKTIVTSTDTRFFERSLSYEIENNRSYLYSLSIPKDYQQRSMSVIMYLHGKGGNENSELLSFSNYVDSIVEECGIAAPLIVFPSNEKRLYVLDQNRHLASDILTKVSERYTLKSNEKRLIAGFSAGGAAATRTAITNPGSYASSVSWAGGVWPKDTYLFNAVKRHAKELNKTGFKAHLFQGTDDAPRAYDPLISVMDQHQVVYTQTILENQNHALSQYFNRTREAFKSIMCTQLQ